MIFRIAIIALTFYSFLSFGQEQNPTSNFLSSLDLLEEDPKPKSDSTIRLTLISEYGPLIFHKFEKTHSGYLNTTKVLFLENPDRDLITFEYQMESEQWKKAFSILDSDFQELDSTELDKDSRNFVRIISLNTPSTNKLVQRPNKNYKTQKLFKEKWWELRSLALVSAELQWRIYNENGSPIRKADIDLGDGLRNKTNKEGNFNVRSAIEFFDKSKHIAWIRMEGYKLTKVEYDLSEFSRSKEHPSRIKNEQIITLKKR